MRFLHLSSSLQSIGYVHRANPSELQTIFEKYASAEVEGARYMTDADFFVRYLGLFPEKDYNQHSAKLLGGVLDTSKDG